MRSQLRTPRFRFVDTHAEKMLGLFAVDGALTATELHRALRHELTNDELTIGAIYRALGVLVRVGFVHVSDSRELETKRLTLQKPKPPSPLKRSAGRSRGTVSAATYQLTGMGDAAAAAYRLRLAAGRRLGATSSAWLASQMRDVYQTMHQASLHP